MIRIRLGGGAPGTFAKFQQVAPPGRRSGALADRPVGWDKIHRKTFKNHAFYNIPRPVGWDKIRKPAGGMG